MKNQKNISDQNVAKKFLGSSYDWKAKLASFAKQSQKPRFYWFLISFTQEMEDFMQMKIMSKQNGDGFDGATEFGWAGHWRLDSDFKRWEFSQCEKNVVKSTL